LKSEGFKRSEIESADFVDLRYRGQSYELTVPLAPHFLETFHDVHDRRYGYANRGRPVEVVNVRTTFIGRTLKPKLTKAARQRGKPASIDSQLIWMDRKRL